MAKNLLFSLFFFTLPFVCLSIPAPNEAPSSENITLKADECNAPAPDSFRITSIGGSFISLAWKPAWVGATYVLTISEKSPSGGWTTQYVLPNVPDSSYTVNDLESGKEYRFRIATKCPSGDPSELTSFVDGIALIVDLTLLGRIPKNPSGVDCQGIDYHSNNWIGFRISGEGASNLFEVKINEASDSPIGYIKRVATDNSIVAVDEDGFFPTPSFPIIESVPVAFRVRNRKPGGAIDVGYVDLVVNSTIPPTIDLCSVLNNTSKPWNYAYKFTALTASEIGYPGGGAGQGFGKDPTFGIFNAQNPFTDMLSVFISKYSSYGGKFHARLMNTNAQVVFTQEFDFENAQVSFQTDGLPAGVYILQIESDSVSQALKVVKSN